MRHLLLVLPLLLMQVPPAGAQVSLGVGIALPGVRIGINLPSYPEMQRVPGYPVYYAPRAQANFFFYDGLYWVYEGDNWYSSAWYNGPWHHIGPEVVPLYVLRVPVRYYRQPPVYFRSWRADAPPRWGEHWGNRWEQDRRGWDHWDRRASPRPAPLPTYQRKYPQSRYPQEAAQQQNLRREHYRYQTRDPALRQQQTHEAAAPVQRPVQRRPEARRNEPAQHRAPAPAAATPRPAPPPAQTRHEPRPPGPRAAPPEAGRADLSRGNQGKDSQAAGRKDVDKKSDKKDDRKDDRKDERESGGRN